MSASRKRLRAAQSRKLVRSESRPARFAKYACVWKQWLRSFPSNKVTERSESESRGTHLCHKWRAPCCIVPTPFTRGCSFAGWPAVPRRRAGFRTRDGNLVVWQNNCARWWRCTPARLIRHRKQDGQRRQGGVGAVLAFMTSLCSSTDCPNSSASNSLICFPDVVLRSTVLSSARRRSSTMSLVAMACHPRVGTERGARRHPDDRGQRRSKNERRTPVGEETAEAVGRWRGTRLGKQRKSRLT